MLDKTNINEQESFEILDSLFKYWMKENKKALLENNSIKYKKSSKIIADIRKAFEQPPMPGSSKIFWKNLYIILRSSIL